MRQKYEGTDSVPPLISQLAIQFTLKDRAKESFSASIIHELARCGSSLKAWVNNEFVSVVITVEARDRSLGREKAQSSTEFAGGVTRIKACARAIDENLFVIAIGVDYEDDHFSAIGP